MSLVVAKREGNEIYIVSDTKLSRPLETYPELLTAPPDKGIIKSVIINEHICISFVCDDIDVAEIAIRECRKIYNNVSKILNYLLELNIEKNNEIEFIVCISLGPIQEIYEVRIGKKQKTPYCWIGSQKAYSIFQEKLHEWKPGEKKKPSDLSIGMDGVIKSGKDETVNGFTIAVTNRNSFFEYVANVSMAIVPQTIQGNHVITHGTASEGGYTLHIFPSKNRYDVLAIHILQGNFGILYEIEKESLLRPTIVRDVDEIEFSEITESKYGIKPFAYTSSFQKSYFERGNKAFLKHDFPVAIDFYNLGLKDSETTLKAALYFNKGLALLNLRKINQAIFEFNEAIKLDRTYEERVKNALFGKR